MFFKIEPTSNVTAVIHDDTIQTPEDALIHFAMKMDSDMSAYFKATPISETEYKELHGHEL